MGYHDSPEGMALVYEFVERGSLYDNLHKVKVHKTLADKFIFLYSLQQQDVTIGWDERARILKGTCSGLSYL
jgi:hypothetical protein